MSGVFSGIGQATPGQGGVYFLEGQYTVEVARCIVKQSRKKSMLYIVEALIKESSVAERPPGMKCSWIANLSTQEAALGNVKGFLAACQGADPNNEAALAALFTDESGADITEQVAEYSVSDDQPMAGSAVHLEAVGITTRAGQPFTLHKWSPAAIPGTSEA